VPTPATTLEFRCLAGISDEHRALIMKHGTLDRSMISRKLLEKKIMTADEILQLLDQLIHRAVKDALLKEEQEIKIRAARAGRTASKEF